MNIGGVTRALSLGVVNGPYVTHEEDGTPVLNLGEVAAELINSGWLAEVVREAKEEAWDESVSDFQQAHSMDNMEPRPYLRANPYRRNEGEHDDRVL